MSKYRKVTIFDCGQSAGKTGKFYQNLQRLYAGIRLQADMIQSELHSDMQRLAEMLTLIEKCVTVLSVSI